MKTEDYQNILRHDFSSFVQFAFAELYTYGPYRHNWHIDVMAHYLSLVENGTIKRLIINMPPRMLKSHCASVALPTWALGRNPRKKLLYLHGGKTLGLELEDTCVDLMNTRRYRALFPSTIIRWEKGRLRTNFGGRRQFMPIMGRLTGLGADMIIIDDPISTNDVRDAGMRKRLHDQFDENIVQRLNDKKNGAIVVVMQRLHENDLTAHLLAKDEGWVHLNLPAVAMKDEIWEMPYGPSYIRKKGEVLHPVRESREDLIKTLISIGGYAFAYQYLQGDYQLRFGKEGHGCVWTTPYRDDQFWDARNEPAGMLGFNHFDEKDLILPRVFGIGEDPIPSDMRHDLTMEEWKIGAQETIKYQERLNQEYESAQSAQ